MEKSEAIGYMIMAAIDIGLDKITIKNLKSAMRESIDTYTEQCADQEYDDF